MTDYIVVHYSPMCFGDIAFYGPHDELMKEFPSLLPKNSQVITSYQRVNPDGTITRERSDIIVALENLCQDDRMYLTCERQKNKSWVKQSIWEEVDDDRENMSADELLLYYLNLKKSPNSKKIKVVRCVILIEKILRVRRNFDSSQK